MILKGLPWVWLGGHRWAWAEWISLEMTILSFWALGSSVTFQAVRRNQTKTRQRTALTVKNGERKGDLWEKRGVWRKRQGIFPKSSKFISFTMRDSGERRREYGEIRLCVNVDNRNGHGNRIRGRMGVKLRTTKKNRRTRTNAGRGWVRCFPWLRPLSVFPRSCWHWAFWWKA